MQFLVDPGDELVPNPPLTPKILEVVCTFVEELKSLGVDRSLSPCDGFAPCLWSPNQDNLANGAALPT
jgi:hypothetical protein